MSAIWEGIQAFIRAKQAEAELSKILFQDLWEALKTMLNVFDKIPDIFSWLPMPCVIIVLTCFAVVILYKILGREG